VWWLALITLINRAGTMVIPFLSLYLKEDLQFTLPNIGWLMSVYGLGSVGGAWLGGKLTDKIGYYKVMTYSLFLTGLLFIGLQFLNTFASLSIGIFITMLVADAFRPAMFVAMSAYSKPENKTRTVTLIRLAINLGFSAGPAVGGLIITAVSYSGLFWIDGITCIVAYFVLVSVLNPKKARVVDDVTTEHPESAYKDSAFLIFLGAMVFFGIVFLQYFSTMPIYYRDVHTLSELQIGLLLGANGLFIFLLEMPLIKWIESKSYSKVEVMLFGAILVGGSFIVLNFTGWSGVLLIGMLLMTIGEMVIFPFSNSFAVDRAKKGNQGEYMALYSMAFSVGHIFGHNAGMQMTNAFGFDNTWYIITLLAMLCAILLFILKRYITKNEVQ